MRHMSADDSARGLTVAFVVVGMMSQDRDTNVSGIKQWFSFCSAGCDLTVLTLSVFQWNRHFLLKLVDLCNLLRSNSLMAAAWETDSGIEGPRHLAHAGILSHHFEEQGEEQVLGPSNRATWNLGLTSSMERWGNCLLTTTRSPWYPSPLRVWHNLCSECYPPAHLFQHVLGQILLLIHG